jgi:hypothetical protein
MTQRSLAPPSGALDVSPAFISERADASNHVASAADAVVAGAQAHAATANIPMYPWPLNRAAFAPQIGQHTAAEQAGLDWTYRSEGLFTFPSAPTTLPVAIVAPAEWDGQHVGGYLFATTPRAAVAVAADSAHPGKRAREEFPASESMRHVRQRWH